MDLKINEHYNGVVIKFNGKLMGGPLAGELNSTLHNLINEGKMNIVVNMSGVTFMNSTGLGILISGLATMKNKNGYFKLAAIPKNIDGILSVTKLNQIFEQYITVDEALKSFK
jgi:anti-sigma B factor antagonist